MRDVCDVKMVPGIIYNAVAAGHEATLQLTL